MAAPIGDEAERWRSPPTHQTPPVEVNFHILVNLQRLRLPIPFSKKFGSEEDVFRTFPSRPHCLIKHRNFAYFRSHFPLILPRPNTLVTDHRFACASTSHRTSTKLSSSFDPVLFQPSSLPRISPSKDGDITATTGAGKNDLLHIAFLPPCEHGREGDMHAHAFGE